MKKVFAITLAAFVTSGLADVPNNGIALANTNLQSGEADRALNLLSSMPSSAETHNLRCRVYFTGGLPLVGQRIRDQQR